MNGIQLVVFALLGLWAVGMTVAALKLRSRVTRQATGPKPLYRYILDMLDYAEALGKRTPTDKSDIQSYFITLVYIEDMLDKYARGLVRESAYETFGNNQKASEIFHLAQKRMDELRHEIRNLAQQYNFDEALKFSGTEIYNNWHKLPDDHPNIQANPNFQA